jgi:hypothetical protein
MIVPSLFFPPFFTLPSQKPAAEIAGFQFEQIADVEKRQRPLPIVAEEPGFRVRKQTLFLFALRAPIFFEAEHRVLDQRHDQLSFGLQGEFSPGAVKVLGRSDNVRLKQGLHGVSGVGAVANFRMQGDHDLLLG